MKLGLIMVSDFISGLGDMESFLQTLYIFLFGLFEFFHRLKRF